jgi:hypothetical protein
MGYKPQARVEVTCLGIVCKCYSESRICKHQGSHHKVTRTLTKTLNASKNNTNVGENVSLPKGTTLKEMFKQMEVFCFRGMYPVACID